MTSTSWWSRKLGGSDDPHANDRPPRPPVQPWDRPRPSYPDPPKVSPDNVFDAALQWHGGDARVETGHCPQCGSGLYFSRGNASPVVTPNGMARVPGRCYSCGYTDGRPMQGSPA